MPKDAVALEAEVTQLTSQVSTLTTAATTAQATITALTTENTTLKASNGTLTTQLGTANANLSAVTAERDTLKANQDTAIAAGVAAKLAALGISDTGAKKEGGEGAKKLSATEKVLAHKGVKTLAELGEKKK